MIPNSRCLGSSRGRRMVSFQTFSSIPTWRRDSVHDETYDEF